MKHSLLLSFLLLATVATALAEPRRRLKEVTRQDEIDSLVLRLNRHYESMADNGIARLSCQVYVNGTSRCTRRGIVARLLGNILPFEASGRVSAFESVVQASYQYPYQLQFDRRAMRSTTRRAKRQQSEVYQVLLPIYSMARKSSDGGKSSYVLPFSDDGLNQYTFDVRDTLTVAGEPFYWVSFTPRQDHHSLISGYAIVSPVSLRMSAITFTCLIDFGKADISMHLGNHDGKPVLERSHITIHYNYGGSTGINDYDCIYDYQQMQWLSEVKRRDLPLDLTAAYDVDPLDAAELDEIRPEPLPAEIDSLLGRPVATRTPSKKRSPYQRIPQYLVSSSSINAFGTNLKVYGPLNPASFGYDHTNGFTVRERVRWSHAFDDGRTLLVKPEVGYSFKMEEWRYSLNSEWVYMPERRAGLRLQFQKRTSGFSSKFQDVVNQAIKASDSVNVNFDQLGIDYYRLFQTKLEHSFELANGLMLYAGFNLNYRDPVRHGQRAVPHERLDSIVSDHYVDVMPYLRLVWTLRQYYRFNGRQKLYVDSHFPTFELQVARGLKHVFGSDSDFGQVELDLHQAIRLAPQRTLYYRYGSGVFFRQKGEYFINYHYFSRSQYPDTWDYSAGSVFNLLDDYWFSSSPSYMQAHVMYESPFLLLHKVPAISRFVIKERMSVGALWAEGKRPYTEFGYGMGNNYFSASLFVGFEKYDFYDFGVKFAIDIDQHW